MTLHRRAVAAIAIAGLLSLQAGVACAGWQSAADARMACCAPEVHCPMEASTADTCCAMSEPGSAAREVPAPASLLAAASLLDGATISAFQPVIASRVPPAPAPPPPGLARHVLLSVFLV